MRIKFKFEESIMLDLNEFLKKENGKSGIAFIKAELRAEDYRLPFGGISSFCIDDENYNLFAKLEIKYSSIFPRIQDSRLTIYWENESQDVIIQKIEELTVHELNDKMLEMNNFDFEIKVSRKSYFKRFQWNDPNVRRILVRCMDDSKLPLEVRNIPGKDRGVMVTKKLFKGQFVVEYAGELIEEDVAKIREEKYTMDETIGSYLFYFKENGKKYCIDATQETGRYGRLINHSCKHPNLVPKTIMVRNRPRLILVAKHDIELGTELLFDYGDRSKESRDNFPWLKT